MCRRKNIWVSENGLTTSRQACKIICPSESQFDDKLNVWPPNEGGTCMYRGCAPKIIHPFHGSGPYAHPVHTRSHVRTHERAYTCVGARARADLGGAASRLARSSGWPKRVFAHLIGCRMAVAVKVIPHTLARTSHTNTRSHPTHIHARITNSGSLLYASMIVDPMT